MRQVILFFNPWRLLFIPSIHLSTYFCCWSIAASSLILSIIFSFSRAWWRTSFIFPRTLLWLGFAISTINSTALAGCNAHLMISTHYFCKTHVRYHQHKQDRNNIYTNSKKKKTKNFLYIRKDGSERIFLIQFLFPYITYIWQRGKTAAHAFEVFYMQRTLYTYILIFSKTKKNTSNFYLSLVFKLRKTLIMLAGHFIQGSVSNDHMYS